MSFKQEFVYFKVRSWKDCDQFNIQRVPTFEKSRPPPERKKPLSELLREMPEHLTETELTHGYLSRCELLFEPSLQTLLSYEGVLRRLEQQIRERGEGTGRP